jgi:polyphosphate kinase 2 (PPK2 family)
MWRSLRCLPARGKIGIFNRSYYEEVLVVRVHPELLDKQRIPDRFRKDHFWKHRFEDINSFERYLTRNGIAVRKFYLNLSRKEQKKRHGRLTNPIKQIFTADVKNANVGMTIRTSTKK